MGAASSRDDGVSSSSSRKPPKITPQDRAILDLKVQRDKIRQYQKKLTTHLQLEHNAARTALARGDKERAKTALRRKRYQETLLQRTDGQLETLQELVSSIEFSQIQASVMQGLAQGNAALKEIHKELNVEAVEKLMDETERGVAYQREIDEMLMSRMTAEDEEAVASEMAALEAEATGVPLPSREEGDEEERERKGLLDLPAAPTQEPVILPSAPKTEPGTKQATTTSSQRTREEVRALREAAEEPMLA